MDPSLNPSSGPLQEAIARRAGVLNQQGPGSATPSPLPSPAPQGNPQMVQAAPGAAMGTPQASQGGQNSPERVDDAHIILKAMESRLKSQQKIAEHLAGIPSKMPSGQGM